MRFKLAILILILVLSACKKDDSEFNLSDSKRYFPLFEGKEWVDSIVNIWIDSPSNIYDTSLIIYRTVVDSAVSQSVSERYYCSVYKKQNETWVIDHVFWYEISTTQLTRFEDNTMWLDMVYPLTEGKEWNPYAYNVNSDTILRNRVHSINESSLINNVFYDSTLTIYHQMDSTLIYKYTDVSKFAAGIGLISKEKVSIISDDPNYDYTLPIDQRIKTGQFVKVKRNYNYENY